MAAPRSQRPCDAVVFILFSRSFTWLALRAGPVWARPRDTRAEADARPRSAPVPPAAAGLAHTSAVHASLLFASINVFVPVIASITGEKVSPVTWVAASLVVYGVGVLNGIDVANMGAPARPRPHAPPRASVR